MTSTPLFQAPETREQRYEPAQVGPEELEEIKVGMRANRIQITPDNLRHALETEEIRRLLREAGINPDRRVSATRDREGMVKLTFSEFRTIARNLTG